MDGLLKLYETTSVHIVKSNAEEATKSEVHVAGSVPCQSVQMLVHGDKLSETLLSRADQALALLDYSNEDAILAALNALGIEGRAKAGKDLYAAWDLLIQAHELCKETQQFLEMSNLSNLVSWANDRRAPDLSQMFDRPVRPCFLLKSYPSLLANTKLSPAYRAASHDSQRTPSELMPGTGNRNSGSVKTPLIMRRPRP